MAKSRRRIIGPIISLLLLLSVILLFLGIEMSSPYTRASPDCSVWCVLGETFMGLVGLGDSTTMQ